MLTPLALGCAGAIAWYMHAPRVVQASVGGNSSDLDGDGLSNKLEIAFGTDPYVGDTDGDGMSDTEEIARHSSPTKPLELPGASAASLGMGIHQSSTVLRVTTAIYLADGVLDNKSLNFGIMTHGAPVFLPTMGLGTSASVTTVPAAVPGELVAVYEYSLSLSILRTATSSASIYSVLTGPGGLKAADAVNIARINGATCQRLVLTTQSGGSPGTTLQVSAPHAGGTIFRPIAGTNPPASWTPGEICNQLTKLVGYTSGAAVQEVIAAQCETGWDAYCDPSCSASVGTTITILDPAVLIGG